MHSIVDLLLYELDIPRYECQQIDRKSNNGFAYYLAGFLITHSIITLVKRSAIIPFAIKYEKQKEVLTFHLNWCGINNIEKLTFNVIFMWRICLIIKAIAITLKPFEKLIIYQFYIYTRKTNYGAVNLKYYYFQLYINSFLIEIFLHYNQVYPKSWKRSLAY